ncbi:Alpha-acetolactate decarboxylase [Penicillium rolfsii]|nr:Alpha-acetolactate decarboxylase [Penicillium rolfsii]
MTTPNHLYQYSLISGLAQGICGDGLPMSQILTHGDHGLGTLAGLDGEVIIMNGQAFQYTSSGSTRALDDSDITAFLMITFFKPSRSVVLGTLTHQTLMHEMLALFPSTSNHFWGIRVDAMFERIEYRVVPHQNYPGERLADVAKRQRLGSFTHQRGTIFGFHSPRFTSAFSVVGLHLHFISEDTKVGGHVLGFYAQDVSLQGAIITEYHVQLPETAEFRSETLAESDRDMIMAAEGLHR